MPTGNKDDSAKDPLTSEITRVAAINDKSLEQKKLTDMPKSTEFFPKPDLAGLSDVLQLPVGSRYFSNLCLDTYFRPFSFHPFKFCSL